MSEQKTKPEVSVGQQYKNLALAPPDTARKIMKPEPNTEAAETAQIKDSPAVDPSTACCVPYSSMPLESDATFETRAWTYKFPDGRKVTTAIAKDGSDEGMWFRITKPLEDGKESELKFRLSLEAAAVLAQLIDYALEYPHNVKSDGTAGDGTTDHG